MTRTWHHHGSDTPTSHRVILLHSLLLVGGGDRIMNHTVGEQIWLNIYTFRRLCKSFSHQTFLFVIIEMSVKDS